MTSVSLGSLSSCSQSITEPVVSGPEPVVGSAVGSVLELTPPDEDEEVVVESSVVDPEDPPVPVPDVDDVAVPASVVPPSAQATTSTNAASQERLSTMRPS